MSACSFDIAESPCALLGDLVLIQCANDSGGHPHGQHARWDRRARRDDGASRDQGVLTDFGTIENDRSDPDQRTIADATTVYDRPMAHGNVISQQRWEAPGRNVNRHLILDIGAFADSNPLDVPSQHRAVEDARIGADLDVSDDGGTRCDPDTLVQSRNQIPEAANDCARP